MITLNDVHFWEKMEPTVEVPFENDYARACTLDFNTSGEVPIYIWLACEAEPQLLALIKGRETVKFVVPCAYAVLHKSDDIDVWILTRDGKALHRIAEEEASYTILHVDQPIDPDMARMEKKMMKRMERRQGLISEEIGRLRELEKRIEGKLNGSGAEGKAGSGEAGNEAKIDPPSGEPVAGEGTAVIDAPVADGTGNDVQDGSK